MKGFRRQPTKIQKVDRAKPQSRVSLQWRNVKVSTTSGRQLLKGVSGVALPAEVIALMGASGAGKTTLLNTLLYRNLKGLEVEGEILVNGQNIAKGITSVLAYVQQEDLFVSTLTFGLAGLIVLIKVREHLEVQARMRLPSTSAEARKKRVEQVLREMNLTSSQNSQIGVPGVRKGISGGEMKRLAFATVMLSNPPIVFCDEPTTGLDSHMALQVVKTLESMAADQGKTIICTIHQPSSEVFELFDKVVFLSQGRVAFHGATDEAIYHFAQCGYHILNHTNPADHYIDFAVCEYNMRMLRMMDVAREKRQLHPNHGGSFFSIFYALFLRYAIDNIRNPSILRAKFIQKLFMGIFLSLLYWNNSLDQDGVINLKGALFYWCSELTYATVFGIQAFMPGDYPIVLREYDDRIYPVSAYYLAKIFSFLPIFSVDGMVMVSISYFLVGFPRDAVRFLCALVSCVLLELNVAALGIAVCAISPSYAMAVTVSGPILTIFSLTGGLFTNVALLPDWIRWTQYLSWFRYGYEALMVNVWTHPDYKSIPCTSKTMDVVENCEASGQQVIENLNFDSSKLFFNWIAMLYFTVTIYAVGYLFLVRRVVRNR